MKEGVRNRGKVQKEERSGGKRAEGERKEKKGGSEREEGRREGQMHFFISWR